MAQRAPNGNAMVRQQSLEERMAHEERCMGVMLWKACGDALGALVEGLDAARIAHHYPIGITRYHDNPRGAGCYTDDTQMAVGLARALVAKGGRLDAESAARAYVAVFQPHRGYGGKTCKILAECKADPHMPWQAMAQLATKYTPEGSFANGGAMRIAPVGLVYRNAQPSVLLTAVTAALRLTHVHPVGVDGALIQAAAVGWLSRQPPPIVPMPKQEQIAFFNRLLSHLVPLAQTDRMRAQLKALRLLLRQRPDAVSDAPAPAPAAPGPIGAAGAAAAAAIPLPSGLRVDQLARAQLKTFWAQHLRTPAWQQELYAASRISSEPFQLRADDAVAVALCAFVHHGL
eukprot:CAMPEP_0202862444 /NCGR_PEP_ID=MMETSP1391-20130828/3483_1 /ASSEMBLY_ACC=CAM_ASM_000867 /TAXON_ID=1034604 /ORGANISM="Chlamydomonas leiostraca, Strain SAG 11-49" /LENGTH=344 /DNA_ID=CAMNT_0049541983 /DNA_START=194 /DNA_END=1224 /DNA_ORIENTATION=+